MPILEQQGYKIIFFTDEISVEQEYHLADSVIRVQVPSFSLDLHTRLSVFSEAAKKNNIDVMCFHSGVTGSEFFYETLLFKLLKIPVIGELHGYFGWYYSNGIKPYLKDLPDILSFADGIVVLSRVNELFWKNLGVNCRYIPNPVEKIPEDTVKNKKRNSILWIGRISQTDNGIYDIVPIMEEIVRQIPDAVLSVVGGSESLSLQSVQKVVKEHCLENNIVFCGFQKNVAPFYDQSEVMVLTARAEGFPYVISESKLHKIPLVLYELPYLELLRNGGGYESVPQGDTKALAEKVVSILQNDEKRNIMAKEAGQSIVPFVNHDIGSDWRKLFNDVSVGKTLCDRTESFEMKCVQQGLLDIILDKHVM